MIEGIEGLAQLGGTLATVVIFIWYLTQKDKQSKCTFDAFNLTLKEQNDLFNKTITNHLAHALKVESEMTKSLTKLSGCINSMADKQTNRERTIDRRRKIESVQ
jgi:hypothetical protein